MNLKETAQYQQLKEAMELLHELKVPEHLQQKALEHLLGTNPPGHLPPLKAETKKTISADTSGETGDLRHFMTSISRRGAVAEIPSLLYWAKKNEKKETANERDIVELYRRSGVRPPKNIGQSMRDLSSKKYMRLEAVKGEPGHVRLSRTGEDVVIHELLPHAE
ncbi:MAG TPA: hypothetical protein PLB51_02805 [Candidatus Paceibacterota bacterium]|nr:hypothetical protein [Candidatus Paceibacterota bacterium]